MPLKQYSQEKDKTNVRKKKIRDQRVAESLGKVDK